MKTDKFTEKIKKLDWNKVFNVIMAIIAVMIIAFSCIYDNNLLKLLNVLPSLNPFWLILACLSIFVVWFIESIIIKAIAKSLKKEKYSIFKAIKATMVEQFYTAITPFGVAGQPMMLLTLTRQGLSSSESISLIVRKFLMYQTTLATYSFVVILYVLVSSNQVLKDLLPLALIGFLAQASIIVLLALFSLNKTVTDKLINGVFWILAKLRIIKQPEEKKEKLNEQLDFYLENNKSMFKDKKFTLKLFVLSFCQISALFSVSFLVYKAYNNEGFPVIDMIFSQGFVTMLSSYTPLPGGSGSSEGGFLLVFNMFFDASVVTQAMLLWRFITYYSCIIIGALFSKVDKKQKKQGNTA